MCMLRSETAAGAMPCWCNSTLRTRPHLPDASQQACCISACSCRPVLVQHHAVVSTWHRHREGGAALPAASGPLVHQAEAAMSLVQRFASNLKGLKLKELPGYTSKFAKENLQPEQIRWVRDLVVRSSHPPELFAVACAEKHGRTGWSPMAIQCRPCARGHLLEHHVCAAGPCCRGSRGVHIHCWQGAHGSCCTTLATEERSRTFLSCQPETSTLAQIQL